MQKSTFSLYIFIAVIIFSAVFVLFSSRSLPALVASHFIASGDANGYMPRVTYVGFMLVLTVLIPLIVVFAHSLIRYVPPRFINLPNREYWLSPEQIETTFAFITSRGLHLAALFSAFICFVHWQVIQANAVLPLHLNVTILITGLILFLSAITVWTISFMLHFRRRPE